MHESYAGFGGANDPVRQTALKLRALCQTEVVNCSSSTMTNEEFPDVDCDEVFDCLFIGNA